MKVFGLYLVMKITSEMIFTVQQFIFRTKGVKVNIKIDLKSQKELELIV